MIVITAPTGQIGRRLLPTLLSRDVPLRVIARDPARLGSEVRERVEVVRGSHADAAVVDEAFAGADAVFWLVAADPQAASAEAAYVDFARPACAAFETHGVKRVVGISALGRGALPETGAGHVSATLAMDDMIARTGVAYRALTMPSFMDNLLRQVAPIKHQGTFYGPTAPGLRAPTCAVRDIADAAASLLLDTGWTGVEAVPVLGPEDLSCDEMAEIMSQVLGTPIRYQQTPMDVFKAGLLERGLSEPMAQAMVDMARAKNAGIDNAEPRTPRSTTPTTFRQWCEEVLKPAVAAA